MKCDRGADAWNKFEEITRQWFSYQPWPTCPAKDKHNMGFAKVWRKNFFGEDGVFHMKEFRTNLIYIYIFIHM